MGFGSSFRAGTFANGADHFFRRMSCFSRTTALASYARSLKRPQNDGGEASEASPMPWPMYTVCLEVLLKMSKIEPHEELKARGVVETGGFA